MVGSAKTRRANCFRESVLKDRKLLIVLVIVAVAICCFAGVLLLGFGNPPGVSEHYGEDSRERGFLTSDDETIQGSVDDGVSERSVLSGLTVEESPDEGSKSALQEGAQWGSSTNDEDGSVQPDEDSAAGSIDRGNTDDDANGDSDNEGDDSKNEDVRWSPIA